MVRCDSSFNPLEWSATHRVLVFIPARRCAASFDVMLTPDGEAFTIGAHERREGPSLRRRPGGRWIVPADSDLPDAPDAVIFRVRTTHDTVAHWEALAM